MMVAPVKWNRPNEAVRPGLLVSVFSVSGGVVPLEPCLRIFFDEGDNRRPCYK